MMLRRIAFAVALPVALLATTALATAASSRSTAKVGSAAAGATASKCGAGTGKKATGAPIKLGGIDMLIPGVDFTTIGKVAKAYFDCVNDNGGIKGRPIKYILYNEQLNPAQEAALARKLIESDKVVGVVGNTSFAECGVNWKYYKSKGYLVIGAGVQAECFGTPSFAESNMGPRYSDIGAAQALIRAGVKKIAIASPDSISAYADGGVVKLGAAKGVQVKVFPTHLPVTDASSQLLQMYQYAGDGNGIIIDFTPDTAPAFMKAAEALGIVNKIKWGSSTPIANTFMAGQFSPKWDGHLWINSEFGLLDASQGPDTRLMLAIQKKYAPSIAPQAFGQMGFMDALLATKALMTIKGEYTKESVNDAFKALKDVKTDILCNPWTFGDGVRLANDADRTIVPQDHKFVEKEKCFDIAALPSNNLEEQRSGQ